jgi:hypothetical protein
VTIKHTYNNVKIGKGLMSTDKRRPHGLLKAYWGDLYGPNGLRKECKTAGVIGI